MNKRPFYRAAFVLGTVGLPPTVACGLWVRSERRQEALNRQLVAALMNYDDQQALVLVNSGADPNTRLKALPPPSFRQIWNSLLRRSPMPVNASPTAFSIVCGEEWMIQSPKTGGEPFTMHLSSAQSAAKLIQPMLAHGANIEAKGVDGWTPLMWATYQENPTSVAVLIAHGAKVNSRSQEGGSPLYWAVVYSGARDANDAKNVISQLLAHGADLNLPDNSGKTILQTAQRLGIDPLRSDIVVLLKQAGAKR